MTLKAVAAEIGKTHANLLHHFGSAAGLQAALARLISDRVCAGIAEAVERSRARARPTRSRSSTAPSTRSAGRRRRARRLDDPRPAIATRSNPILDAIHQLVDQLGDGHEDRPVHETTLWLVLAAIGDSLLGAPMAEALGLPREQGARDRAPASCIASPRKGA